MTIEKLVEDGYKLKAWRLSQVKNGARMITLLLTNKRGVKFIAACPCSDKKLIDSDFTIPTEL